MNILVRLVQPTIPLSFLQLMFPLNANAKRFASIIYYDYYFDFLRIFLLNKVRMGPSQRRFPFILHIMNRKFLATSENIELVLVLRQRPGAGKDFLNLSYKFSWLLLWSLFQILLIIIIVAVVLIAFLSLNGKLFASHSAENDEYHQN